MNSGKRQHLPNLALALLLHQSAGIRLVSWRFKVSVGQAIEELVPQLIIGFELNALHFGLSHGQEILDHVF